MIGHVSQLTYEDIFYLQILMKVMTIKMIIWMMMVMNMMMTMKVMLEGMK